ncbi:hypothetical protein OG921_26415 [Aldersonia sp. NBC_00410]|uniref:hypothetical protein n=1 Tax=Aldersonia sp. NBC_00410 TaxID=2975954 RepID=UPI002252EBD6|nr:hypothetical protein [Aldersonia sp. NBC_00410]MCX5046714.1 hypothetical protein [Aldersonia sp. NBC_00410]
MNTPSRPVAGPRPPVPAALHSARSHSGLVVPYITAWHAGRPMWGHVAEQAQARAITDGLCQVCGLELDDTRIVLTVRPQDIAAAVAPEPGLHPACLRYAVAACPMLSGTRPLYRPVGHGPGPCDQPDCDCALWAPADSVGRAEQPAEAWYELWISPADYRPTAYSTNGRQQIGISLRDVRPRRMRKIRASEPGASHAELEPVIDLTIATTALFSK